MWYLRGHQCAAKGIGHGGIGGIRSDKKQKGQRSHRSWRKGHMSIGFLATAADLETPHLWCRFVNALGEGSS